MHRIELDAGLWRTEDELWRAILGGLGAPDCHGRNLDALWDTVTESAHEGVSEEEYINRVQPPFEIVVTGAAKLPPFLSARLERVKRVLEDAKQEHRLNVSLSM